MTLEAFLNPITNLPSGSNRLNVTGKNNSGQAIFKSGMQHKGEKICYVIQNFEYALCTRQPISNHQLPFNHKMLTSGKSKNNNIKAQEFFNLHDSQIDMLLNVKA
ncbi:hypothetical protein AAZX31_08G259000 [Glycine max]